MLLNYILHQTLNRCDKNTPKESGYKQTLHSLVSAQTCKARAMRRLQKQLLNVRKEMKTPSFIFMARLAHIFYHVVVEGELQAP